MIIDFNRYNGGGGSASGVTPQEVQRQIDSALTPYWESGETKDYVDEAVSGLATEQYVQDALSGVNLDNYWTSAITVDAISAATSGKADKVAVTPNTDDYSGHFPTWNADGVITGEGATAYRADLILNGDSRSGFWSQDGNSPSIYAPTISGNPGEILVSTGSGAPVWSAVTMGGNSNILAAISSQTEYEAISGSVKTGDLIQVRYVDINGLGPEDGLFEADVQEIEDHGVITKEIIWERRDSQDSLNWNYKDYSWMTDNDVYPVDLGAGSFLISLAEGGYNGIGFDGEGKPVITHIVPEEDEQTGEITGMTRTDTPIGGGSSEDIELPIAAAVNELKGDFEVRLSQKYYTRQEVNDIAARKVEAGQVNDQIKDYVDPAIAEINATIEDKELATSAALNELNSTTVKSTTVKNIWTGSQSDYDDIVVKDPETLYIINN